MYSNSNHFIFCLGFLKSITCSVLHLPVALALVLSFCSRSIFALARAGAFYSNFTSVKVLFFEIFLTDLERLSAFLVVHFEFILDKLCPYLLASLLDLGTQVWK